MALVAVAIWTPELGGSPRLPSTLPTPPPSAGEPACHPLFFSWKLPSVYSQSIKVADGGDNPSLGQNQVANLRCISLQVYELIAQ